MRKKYIIEDCPEYVFSLIEEDFDGLKVPFIHVTYKQWSPSILKRSLKTWKAFRESIRGTFFALADHDDLKTHEKFVKRFGFEHYRPIVCPDGKTRPCYVSWDKING